MTPDLQQLIDIWTEANVPDDLQRYLGLTCSITSIKNFLDYVVREDFQTEWKDIVMSVFPVTTEFTMEAQRMYVSKLRGSYRIALEMEDQIAEKKSKKEKDKDETDMEKPLSKDDVKELKKSWRAVHDWDPSKYMIAHPRSGTGPSES